MRGSAKAEFGVRGLLSLLLLILLCGCVTQQQAPKGKPITIGIDVFPGWGHAFIAKEKGFFKKNGANVELVLNPDYLTVQSQFANGELDGAFMVYADAIYANDAGTPSKVVYISDHSVTGDVIAANPEYKSLQDLKGKTISVEGINSFSHLFVLSALEKNGMKEGDVFIESVGAQDVVAALDSGKIVAGHTYGSGKTKAEEKGYVFLAYAGDVKGIITDTLAFNEKIIRERPDEISAIVKSLFEAKQFQQSNREEALQIIAKAIGDTPDSVASGIDAVDYVNLQQNAQAMLKGEDLTNLYAAGNIIASFFVARGQISEKPDFEGLIEESFVNELLQQDSR